MHLLTGRPRSQHLPWFVYEAGSSCTHCRLRSACLGLLATWGSSSDVSGEAPTSLWRPRLLTRPDEGDKQALPWSPRPSPCSDPAAPPAQLGSSQGAHLPDPQAPPHPPADDSSWRMSGSPLILASTRISVPQSPRKPAASVCPPAATEAGGHAPAPTPGTGGTQETGGPTAVLRAEGADLMAGVVGRGVRR